MAPRDVINWAIYNSLPPQEAEYQLAHIHDSKRASIAITFSICQPILFLAVFMRLVSRRIGRTEYGADDWIMVLGLTLVVANSIPTLLGVFAYGGARHVILITEKDLPRFAKSVFAAEMFYAPTIAVVKISTLLLFARIFPSRNFKVTLWAVGLFISTYSIAMVIAVGFQCRPIKRIWVPDIKAECIDISKLWIVMASLNVVTDFLLLCLPLPQLWKLQMRRGTKIQLIGIFSIGSFATVISIYRIPQLRNLSLNSYDPPWSDVGPSLWSIVEVAAITLGACAITYRPLFNRTFKIRPPSAAFEAQTTFTAGATKQSNTNTRTALQPNRGMEIEMQTRSVFQVPHPSSSLHSPRMVGLGDGFSRIRDSMES